MPTAPASRDLRFLDPAVIARLGTMELKARTVVEGFLSGLHRSPYKGFSVEFAEYRQYLPGDDLSTLDWKVYARTDRHYVKKFEEETNLECHLLLDQSASMAYRGGAPMTKLEYGSVLAGVARVPDEPAARRDRPDRVRRADPLAPAGRRAARPPARAAARARAAAAGATSDVGRPLHQLAEALIKRSLVVLISDLLDDPEPVIKGLRHLKFRGTDVVVFQVLDPHELTFPFQRLGEVHATSRRAEAVVAEPAERAQGISARAGRPDAALRPRAARRRHRLRAARHVAAARLRAADLSVGAGRRKEMNFLYPAFLLGALAVAIPIVLHLLRRDVAPEVPFTAVRLLRKSPVERSRRRRLRDMLLLAARVAALLLLAAAFARPFAPGASGRHAPLRIVAIDRSFSMGGAGRFERALELARAAVDEAGFGERDRGDDVRRARRRGRAAGRAGRGACARWRRCSPATAATRYAAVVAKASELASGGPARLVVITDLQRAGLGRGVRGPRCRRRWRIELETPGAARENLAIAALRADDRRVVASVRNASADGRGRRSSRCDTRRRWWRVRRSAPADASRRRAVRLEASGERRR